LFRSIALKELGWRVVDCKNRVIDPADPNFKDENQGVQENNKEDLKKENIY